MIFLSSVRTPAVAPGTARRAEDAAHRAVGNVWVGRFLRFGQIMRGVIYAVFGLLVLRLALGMRGEDMSETGAIEMIGHQPFGRTLLVGVAVGLAGYALLGVVRAVLDPLRKGDSPRGIAKRLGFAASAVGYAGLLFFTLSFVVGSLPHATESTDLTAKVLAKPFGKWLLGMIGVCWIAVAGGKIVQGWQGKFVRDLDCRSATERWWALNLGRIGIVTRGVVFTIIGIFLVTTAFRSNPHPATGTDGALLWLLQQPFGRAFLAVAGLGIFVFGVFSAMCARWLRIRKREPGPTPG